jgi:predicted metal-dependent hydrolase
MAYMNLLKYLLHYPETTRQQVKGLIENGKLGDYLLSKYPEVHGYGTDRALYAYALEIKNEHMRKSQPLSKALYDGKIHIINNALGTHTYAKRVQGGKIKTKNEIRVATMFKNMPEPFLKMIIVHELAHFKEKEHNKAFYKLCQHMEPDYHQLEFDTRLYLTHVELFGKLY